MATTKKEFVARHLNLHFFVPSRTSVSDGGNECLKDISQKFVGKVFLRNSWERYFREVCRKGISEKFVGKPGKVFPRSL
jgi:hypothetical protein